MTSAESDWRQVAAHDPPEDVLLETRIADDHGVRNVQPLIRRGSLWWLPKGDLYVYYTPTDWRPIRYHDPELGGQR